MPKPSDRNEVGGGKEEFDSLKKRAQELEMEKDKAEKELLSLRSKVGGYERQLEVKESELNSLRDESEHLRKNVELLINERQKLVERLDKIQRERPSFPLDELAKSIKRAIESMQKEIAKPSEEKAPRYAIETFDIEIKGGIEPHAAGLKLVCPLMEELKPESLSTIKLSLKAKPEIRIAKE